MGNICGRGDELHKNGHSSQTPEKESSSNPDNADLSDMIKAMQKYHLDRIRKELEKDPHTFILDNLLMCIQFFEHFEKSMREANEFRLITEREMTELLAKNPNEGMMLGDRRIKLLTGVSHILAQNYIYRGKMPQDDDDIDSCYGGLGLKDAFMTESILPLEFIMGWDNFELYDQSEDIKEYSDAKGAIPSVRFCMEQPDKRVEFPKGYIRLRCIDDPISHRKQLNEPDYSNSDQEYGQELVYNKPYSDVVSEANSESDGTAPHSGTTSEDEDIVKLQEILRGLPSRGVSSPLDKEQPSTSKAARQAQINEAGTPKNKLKLNIPHSTAIKNEPFPTLVVHAATPPVFDGQFQMNPFENNGLLFPHTKLNRNQYSRSTPNLSTSERDSPGKETPSSGYDTTRSSIRSQASSMASEMQREKWQRHNLKRLLEYPKKSRKDQIPTCGTFDPIPADCYTEVKFEYQYDAPEEEEENITDNDGSEVEIDFSSGKLKRINARKNEEDDYKLRFYLNSLQFSSNACSEFHCIGPILSIPSESLSSGVVLGTTIRCPIPYTYPREKGDKHEATVGNYYVACTFTPALHSKIWPHPLYFHFNNQIFNGRVHEARWPTRDQMEQLEALGCNAIPLGYRSIGFFNAEQILEWELNFHECEANLLNSLGSPHWRTYIFASILMRGFIAPLGPLGIGLEHIRNILYHMCHEDFFGWNDEQPGHHLTKLLGHLYECLGKGYMPSFFVGSRNLFQSIPPHNIRYVQGHLKQIRENIIIYCIYAFRNLMNVGNEKIFPLPNFKNLYELLTVSDGELLKIVNPILRMHKDKEDEQKREENRQRARSTKRKQQKPNLIDQQDEIDRKYFATQEQIQKPTERDRVQEHLRKNYARRMEKQKKKDQDAKKFKKFPEHSIPESEKRASIDLKRTPIIPQCFSKLRLLYVIGFFIKHFLKMAKRATELENYGLATMYVLHIENLCNIIQEEQSQNVIPIMSEEDLESFREEVLRLHSIIGSDKEQYILGRISFPSKTLYSQLTPGRSDLINNGTNGFPMFTNNWDLRKLPSPPPSEKEIRPIITKKLEKPNIASSLKSFDSFSDHPTLTEIPKPPSPMSPRPPPADRSKPRRQESIKFVSRVLPKDNVPPATPPRMHSRPPSRQSTTLSLVSLDKENELEESTDL